MLKRISNLVVKMNSLFTGGNGLQVDVIDETNYDSDTIIPLNAMTGPRKDLEGLTWKICQMKVKFVVALSNSSSTNK